MQLLIVTRRWDKNSRSNDIWNAYTMFDVGFYELLYLKILNVVKIQR